MTRSAGAACGSVSRCVPCGVCPEQSHLHTTRILHALPLKIYSRHPRIYKHITSLNTYKPIFFAASWYSHRRNLSSASVGSKSLRSQVPLQHRNRHDSHAGHVDARTVAHVGLKVLLLRDVDADTPVLEQLGGDFVVLDGDGADDDVGDLEALGEGEGRWRDDVVWVVARRGGVGGGGGVGRGAF